MAAKSIKAMVDPKDIAALVTSLASDAAKAIFGQVLPIDSDRQRGEGDAKGPFSGTMLTVAKAL